MSKLKKKFGRRILAYLLSGAMILSSLTSSNMTAFASEASSDAGGKSAYEETSESNDAKADDATANDAEEKAEADEVLKDEENTSDENEEVKESSSEAVEETKEKNSEQSSEVKASDEEKASETKSSSSAPKEEKEEKVTDADNKAVVSGQEIKFRGKSDALSTIAPDFSFSGFEVNAASDGHGAKTNAANATITFTVPQEGDKVVDINVLLCTYSSSKLNATMTASAGTVVKDTVGEDDKGSNLTSNPAPKYTVLGVTGGSEIVLTFGQSGTYVHSVTATLRDAGTEYYTIDVSSDNNGTASASPVYAASGDTVTLTAKPIDGYKLEKWEVTSPTSGAPAITTDGNDANKATFTMPASNIEISATFVEDVGATYDVHV